MESVFDKEIAPSKKVRRCTPKVRSGCITCKSRRVKCDEQKPECQRCVRAVRKCEGYPDLARGISLAQLPLEPASITTYSIPFKVPGSQADRQLLHYYCSQAAWNLSCCADPTLWTELILQRANHQPVIRNALVALSSLHKDYLCGELVGSGYETPTSHPRISPGINVRTNNMISRCHRQLRNYLSRTDASPDVALVCSVIFYTFESLLGESQRAIWHLDQGLILLRKCQLDKSFDDPLIPHLSTLLHHLDLQASCFDDRRSPVLHLATDAETKGHVDIVPDTFIDLRHAEAILTKLQNWILHHLVSYVHYRGAPVEALPSESFVERLVLATQLQKFETSLDRFAAYESLISTTTADIRREDQRQRRTQRILLLRVNLHTFSYLVKENLPFLTADSYNLAKKVLDLLPGYNKKPVALVLGPISNAELDLERALAAIDVLLAQSAPDLPSTSPDASTASSARTYTLSTHLIGALYFLSLKTTNKQILDKAVALFSHPRLRYARDGLWDSRTAAFLVDNLVRVRRNGNVTAGSDASDILLQISEGDVNVDIAELERIFTMSHKCGLPMMQSKKFTLVLRKDLLVRSHREQEVPTSSSTVAQHCVRGFNEKLTPGAGNLSTGQVTQLPVPPSSTPSKDIPSAQRSRPFSEGADNAYPNYFTTRTQPSISPTLHIPTIARFEKPLDADPLTAHSSCERLIPQSAPPPCTAGPTGRSRGAEQGERARRLDKMQVIMALDAVTGIVCGRFEDPRCMMGQEREEPDSYMRCVAENVHATPRMDTGGHDIYSGFSEKRMLWESHRQGSFVGVG